MNYIINSTRSKSSRINAPSIKSNKSLIFKTFFLINIILLSFLFTSDTNFTENTIEQTDKNVLENERNLKLSNPGDKFFKFTYGTWLEEDYWSLDPHDTWTYSEASVIDQVCEGLFRLNLSDPYMTPIPNLANGTGTWSSDNLNYTVSLINNATFHDGTEFNATAVKFSFDRLAYFMNSTGVMTDENITFVDSVYRWSDYIPIINRTEIINTTTIRFVLNRPFVGLPGLLCLPASYIVSPTSTDDTKYINVTIGDLVGTGPFVYDGYIWNEEVRFHAYDNYWRGKAQIELLRFKDVSDEDQALLSGEVDFISSPYSISVLEADPNINVIKNWSSTFYYLGMNNKLLNKSWRQAISYAINYSYIIDNIAPTSSKRSLSPLTDGVIYSNTTNNVATFNITKAREIMQSMGYGVTLNTNYPGPDDTQWESSNFIWTEFGQELDLNLLVNLWTRVPSQINQLLNNLLFDNLAKIGCANLTETRRDINQLILNATITPDELDLWIMGWGPDFNDPYSTLHSFYSNLSIGALNWGQVNDTYLQNLMDLGINETDPTARKMIYNNIQKYIVEDLMPMAFLYTPPAYDAHYDYVEGYQPNPYAQIKFYSISQNSSLFPGNIDINGNQEWDTLKAMGKCTGSGNSTDPYIIEDLVIDGQNRQRSCILIENSSRNFIIENCSFSNSAGAGLELIGNNISIDSQIIGNIFTGNNYGIQLLDYNNFTIFDNTFIGNNINAFDNNTYGGGYNSWDNGTIGNYWDDYGGIDVDDNGIGDTAYSIPGSTSSQDNYPLWNDGLETYITLYLNGIDKTIDKSIEIDINTILNITVEYKHTPTENHISLASVNLFDDTYNYSFLEDLTFEQYILQLDTSDLGVGTYNLNISAQKAPSYKSILLPIQITVNEAPESYIVEPFIIDDTGEGDYTWDDAAEKGWCTGSGTEEDPYIIESLEIDGQNSDSCLIIRDSTAFVVIKSSAFSNAGGGINKAGLKLENVSNIALSDINCSNNNANGILLFNCQNITITNCTFNYNDFAGIYLNKSSFNFIVDNTETINHNYWGIYLLFSHNNSIFRNSIGFNIIGLIFDRSNFNSILNNILEANQKAIVVDDESTGNHIEGNTIITKREFPTMIVVISIIGGIIGISGVGTAFILKKKVFIPKPGKEVKVFGKKKTKIERKLEERLSFVDHLIRENKIKDAIKNLNEIKDLSETYGLMEILNECEENLTYCTKMYTETIDKIKNTILDLSTKFARLQTIDISEKTEIPDEELIISVIQEMIRNNEIFAEYFSSSKAIAFDQQKNIELLEKIVSDYAKRKAEEEEQFNVFLSYSTSDSEHFNMPRIVTSLERYPDVGRVLYWEADSKQNIVEFMDETLKKCNVFILFCSEHSIKSVAVKDEWQAAFQRRKKELLKMIPVYEKEENIPPILGHLLNVKFDKEDFNGFIENLHREIQR